MNASSGTLNSHFSLLSPTYLLAHIPRLFKILFLFTKAFFLVFCQSFILLSFDFYSSSKSFPSANCLSLPWLYCGTWICGLSACCPSPAWYTHQMGIIKQTLNHLVVLWVGGRELGELGNPNVWYKNEISPLSAAQFLFLSEMTWNKTVFFKLFR